MWRRAAWAALFVINVSGLLTLQEWRFRQDVGFLLRFINPAETDATRPEYCKIVHISNVPKYSHFSSANLNFLDLRPIKNLAGAKLPVAVSLVGRNGPIQMVRGVLKGGFVGYVERIEAYFGPSIGYKSLGAPLVKNCDDNGNCFVCNNRIWNYCFDIDIERRAFTLDESPTLNDANYRQNSRENADNASPANHGPIKGLVLLVLIGLGTWVGIWSIVFWDPWGSGAGCSAPSGGPS